jgi:hypothetical protein
MQSDPVQCENPPTVVHNQMVDPNSFVVVDILAPWHLTKEEMEVLLARALQKLKSDDRPKAGDMLTVVATSEHNGQTNVVPYERRWPQ